MGFASVLSFARQLAKERIRPGDVVIDATVGNGIDTEFLAASVGAGGTVYGFDIQQQALEKARERLAGNADAANETNAAANVRLFLRSHADMAEVIPRHHHGFVAAVMFNLGYLPGAEHGIITRPESTLPALDASLSLLKTGGIITIVVYPGHPGGQEEADAVMDWSARLPQKSCQALCYRFLNQINNPPFLIAVEKR